MERLSGLTCRPASSEDRAQLASFAATGLNAAAKEVIDFIRTGAITRCGTSDGREYDCRLLLFHMGGDLVGVAVHERNWRVEDESGATLGGREVVAFALADSRRLSRTVTGAPLLGTALQLLVADAVARGDGSWMTALVHPGNREPSRLLRSLGARMITMHRGGYEVYVIHAHDE